MKLNLITCYAAAALLLLQGCAKNIATKQTDSQVINPHAKANVISGSYGAYEITNVAGGKCMEVTGGSLANGGGVGQWDYYAGGTSGDVDPGFNNQVWQVIDQGTGYYKIMNLRSGKYLEAAFPGPQLWQNSADGLDAELWQITAVGFGAYKIINKANGLAATNHASSTSNGTAITEETFASSTSQYWVFTPVSPAAYRDDAVVSFFHRGKVSGTTVAFDQGNSIPLSNGKVVWMTQDAWDASQLQSNGYFACSDGSPYHNSALIQPSITNWTSTATPNMTTNNSSGQPLQVLATQPGEIWTWPGYGIEISGHMYVHCTEGGDGNGYFNYHDQVIYDFTENLSGTGWGTAVRKTVTGLTGQNTNADYIQWYNGTVDGHDGYVYVYGTYYYATGSNPYLSHSGDIYVARYPKTTVGVSNWTFWNGSSFVANIPVSSMVKVATAKDALATVSVQYVNGKYVLMNMDYGFSCDPSTHDIYLAVATSPTGTFGAFKKVFTIPDVYQGHIAQYYTPVIHPEFVNGHNELLLTYCLNFYTACPSTCTDGLDPNYYQIKAVRVPYSMVGL